RVNPDTGCESLGCHAVRGDPIVPAVVIGNVDVCHGQRGVDLPEHTRDVHDAEVLVRDVVNTMWILTFLREGHECSRTVSYVEERSPLSATAENLDLVTKCAVEAEDVDDQIEAHTGGAAKERAVAQDDG